MGLWTLIRKMGKLLKLKIFLRSDSALESAFVSEALFFIILEFAFSLLKYAKKNGMLWRTLQKCNTVSEITGNSFQRLSLIHFMVYFVFNFFVFCVCTCVSSLH